MPPQYAGSARVARRHLRFHGSSSTNEHIDRIPAIIDRAVLHQAIEASGVTLARFRALSQQCTISFDDTFRLDCLAGEACVRHSNDLYWNIDFFYLSATIPEEVAIEDLALEYTLLGGNPSDGEIYSRIRKYMRKDAAICPYPYVGTDEHRGDDDDDDKNGRSDFWTRRWLNLCSKTRRKNLFRILKDQEFSQALDIQLSIPGLKSGMRLGTFHKLHAMGCREELLNYLAHVKEFWIRVCARDIGIMSRITEQDVAALETKAPGICNNDRMLLISGCQTKRLFSQLEEEERDAVRRQIEICTTQRLIPSLRTFFEDVNYLQLPATCVRLFAPVSGGQSISNRLHQMLDLSKSRACVIEHSDSTMGHIHDHALDVEVRAELSRRQVWLCAMRNCKDSAVLETGLNLLAKPRARSEPLALAELLHLLRELGYNSEAMRRQEDEFMRYFEARDGNSTRETSMLGQEAFRSSSHTLAWDRESLRRCGIPKMSAYNSERDVLFIHEMHTPLENVSEVDPFIVRRSVYLAFFRELSFRAERVLRNVTMRSDTPATATSSSVSPAFASDTGSEAMSFISALAGDEGCPPGAQEAPHHRCEQRLTRSDQQTTRDMMYSPSPDPAPRSEDQFEHEPDAYSLSLNVVFADAERPHEILTYRSDDDLDKQLRQLYTSQFRVYDRQDNGKRELKHFYMDSIGDRVYLFKRTAH